MKEVDNMYVLIYVYICMYVCMYVQAEDDGPTFYAKKDCDGGQWDKPMDPLSGRDTCICNLYVCTSIRMYVCIYLGDSLLLDFI